VGRGKSQACELASRIATVLEHLIKLEASPALDPWAAGVAPPVAALLIAGMVGYVATWFTPHRGNTARQSGQG
jgi:hypothetical protein